MPKFEVELNMFMKGKIRVVDVPREKLKGKTLTQQLDEIFYFGQNDFQPQKLPSVSAGDIIQYKGNRYIILSLGFKKLRPGQQIKGNRKLIKLIFKPWKQRTKTQNKSKEQS
jgi:hypothetical protein